MIIMFIGPSSSGKDLFYKKTLEKYNLQRIILYSTRPKRINEENGREYFFVSTKEMDTLDQEHKLIERRDYDTIHGIWSYATRGDNLDLNQNYLVINTWDGYQKYIDYFDESTVYPFYFDLDQNTRFERAYEREKREKEKKYLEMCRRFLADEKDFSKDKLLKYHPIMIDNNGSIENTEKQIEYQLKKIIK